MPPNTSKELFRRYVGIWETGKLDGLGAILHDDYVSGAQGCEETLEALDRHRAFFETAASRPPQDEEFS